MEHFVQIVAQKGRVVALTNRGRIFVAVQVGTEQTAWTQLPLPDFHAWSETERVCPKGTTR